MNAPNPPIVLNESEVEFVAIRAQGAGGQNVNKVSNAIHLRFNIGASSLPEEIKARLLQLRDQRISAEGVIVIKAQQHRSLEQNRAEAMQRLNEMVQAAALAPRLRRATRPTHASKLRRLQGKAQRGEVKASRGKPLGD